MADQWIHMYHQNNNQQLSFNLSDHRQVNNDDNSGVVSDSTVVTAAISSATTLPTSSGLIPDGGRVSKPVRKRTRASRRTPTTLFNTDAANFRAMVQQFTGGPSNNASNFSTFGFPSNSNAVFDPTVAAYHLDAPPVFQFQNQAPPPPPPLQQPPFMFSLGNSAASETFFQQGGGLRSNDSNVNYMGLFDGSSPTAQNPRSE
ncbi:VQ motif-containing protein 22-like [Cucurbita moschata]|uniref:VQ motif-containing protein 22-like n=1 Tax=Cucurbita moschata TaxID=3662 RepID=A0A6J1FIN8_CUCMO|nr:VQ motif-containing protein 22-like [Cucurbita moschata]